MRDKVEMIHPGLGVRVWVHWKTVPHLEKKGWTVPSAPPPIDLSGLRMDELRQVAKVHDLKVPRGTDKETLVGMIESLLTTERKHDG